MQLLEGAIHLFGKGRKDKERRDQQTSDPKLFQEIGKLCRITSRCRRRGVYSFRTFPCSCPLLIWGVIRIQQAIYRRPHLVPSGSTMLE